MALITKEKLENRGEILLKRLQREYRKLRKIHNIRDEEEIEVISSLNVGSHLLARRVADELKLYAECPPEIVLSREEKLDKRGKAKEINDMFTMINKARDLSRQMLQDIADEQKLGADSRIDEKQTYIDDARKALEELETGLKIDFPLDARQFEGIECERTTIDQN